MQQTVQHIVQHPALSAPAANPLFPLTPQAVRALLARFDEDTT